MNAAEQESRIILPLEVDIGRIPNRPLTRPFGDLMKQSDSAPDFSERQKAFAKFARDYSHVARKAQRYFADKISQDRIFKEGNWVMLLNRRNTWSTRR